MEVILLKDIDGLGIVNELKTVKNGYGRNFLIPKGLAALANDENKRKRLARVNALERKDAEFLEKAEQWKEQLKKETVAVLVKTNETGRIFGAVTNNEIATVLRGKGIGVKRQQIEIIDDPIKEVGSYKAKIILYKDIETSITFEVVSE